MDFLFLIKLSLIENSLLLEKPIIGQKYLLEEDPVQNNDFFIKFK